MTEKNAIPNKSHFTFDEVALITGVKKYVLRFWETEFKEISPIVSSAGQKLFEHKDIEAIFQIKKLLFDQKLSIEKAKAILSQGDSVALTFDDVATEEVIPEVKASPILDRSDAKVNPDILSQAKAKLQSMIDLADAIKKRHNWS